MKRMLAVALGAVVVLLGVLVFRAVTTSSRQVRVAWTRDVTVDANAAATHLARAVTFRTVSTADGAVSDEEFEGLERFIDDTYPRVRAELVKERVARHSLLYTWRGSDAGLKPTLLLAHLDVVLVEPGTEALWTEPPFEGRIANGFIWG